MAKWQLNSVDYDCARIAQKVAIIEKTPYLDADPPSLQDDMVGFPQCCSGMRVCQLFRSGKFALIDGEPIATGCPFIDTRRMAVAM